MKKPRLPHSLIALAVSASMVLGVPADAWAAKKAKDSQDASAAKDAKKKKAEKPPKKCEIHGQVFAADGKTPVAGAKVHYRSLERKDTVESKPSDSKGRFSIGGLEYGWGELAVETPQGTFVSDQAVELLPEGSAAVSFSLTRFEDRPADYWVARAASGAEPGADGGPVGLAEEKAVLAGKDFWKSPKGIAIIAGSAGILLLAVAASAKKSPSATTPVTGLPTTP